MANDYYNHGQEFPEGTTGRGTTVDAEFEKIERAFELLPTPAAGGFGQTLEILQAVSLTAATTLAQVRAEIAAAVLGGGSPGNIPADQLGVGTGLAGQFLGVSPAGTALTFSYIPTIHQFNQLRGIV